MSIEVLVSDLGNVILPFDFGPRAVLLRDRCDFDTTIDAVDPAAALLDLHDRLAFGVGGCSSKEFYRQAVAQLKLDVSYEEFYTLYSDWFWEDQATIDIIRQVRVPHKFLLSNTDSIHWDWLVENYSSALEMFDRLLTSHELKALKPNPQIYRKVEALTGLPSSAHLLIDDMAANTEGARACGWDSIVHTDAAALEAELRARKLLG